MALTVTPEVLDETIDHVSFAFLYGYNKNVMKVYNAMLNISSASYGINLSVATASDSSSSSSTESSGNALDYDGYIYCEAVSEELNTNADYMVDKKSYDSAGNYVIQETNKTGNTVNYTYDTLGNITTYTDANNNLMSFDYDNSGKLTTMESGNVTNSYEYNGNGNISAITHNNFTYQFNFNIYNKLLSTKIGNVSIASNTYAANNGNLIKTTYANGDYVEYTYDEYDNITKITGETGVLAEYIYNKKGLVTKEVDSSCDEITYYYYDYNGTLINKYCQAEQDDLVYYITTNDYGDVVELTTVNGFVKTIIRGSENGELYTINDNITVTKVKDDFDRTTQIKTSHGSGNKIFYTNYSYQKGVKAKQTTNLVNKISYKYDSHQLDNFEYEYDKNGNITVVKENGNTVAKYAYDSLNQLVTNADSRTGTYTKYFYDNAGNITKSNEYALSAAGWSAGEYKKTNSYFYSTNSDWKDKLTSYNGILITYDEVGNPQSYRNGMYFTWENGRDLKTIKLKSGNTLRMKYNAQGMRIQKDDDTYTTNYFYNSQNQLSGIDVHGTVLYFYYDTDGNVTSFNHNGGTYYYIKNVQGDVIRIINAAGTTLVSYTYDAWGNITSQTDNTNYNLANVNPYKYRGYVYDYETGLYYLNSRYYDPVTGRFLNADIYCDTQSSILGTNMFAYCNNNPINQIDPEGTDAYWVQFADGANGWGHTSLLLQDDFNNWWYFYWGPNHVILRPCGKDDFTSVAELNSYLTGFDPRRGHNYYVYATNVIDDSEDVNYSAGSDYYLKCHDKAVTDWMYFLGNFTNSFNCALTLLTNLYANSNATQLIKKVYENGKATYIYDVCAKTIPSNNVNQIVPDHIIPVDYYSEIKLNSNYTGNIRNYDFLSYNCVQVSTYILLEGTFSGHYQTYRMKIENTYNSIIQQILLHGAYKAKDIIIPNVIYKNLIKG